MDGGQMQVGDMMAFIQYTMQIIMAFLMICMISIMLPRAAVAAGRVDEVLTSETAIRDQEVPEHLPEEGKDWWNSTMYLSAIRVRVKTCCTIFILSQGLVRRQQLLEYGKWKIYAGELNPKIL